ncbi:MAG: ribonuclease HII [Verrucomicrobia bacterium]|jgi:ribonuclease HII|nr:ribonuclease HII [Verrucomicrobiota bacterium]
MNLRGAKKSSSTLNRLAFEQEACQRGCRRVAGVDEAGRGPLAGPVVAAAVVLPTGWIESAWPDALAGLNDSKQLTETQREHFFGLLTTEVQVRWAVAWADAATIDRENILRATHQAMRAALEQLEPPPDHILVDGRAVPSLRFPQTALVKGDARSYSIAAASVLAKVTRDRFMLECHAQWPQYGFAGHKGYGTPQHLAAIAEHGPCPIHRLTFAPLKPHEQDLFPTP